MPFDNESCSALILHISIMISKLQITLRLISTLTFVDYAQLFSGAISHVAHVTETGEIVALVESHILDPQQENIDPQVQYWLVLVKI